MNDNKFKTTFDAINFMERGLEDAIKNSEDVQSGACTEDDERNEPAYILTKQIIESVKGLWELPQSSEMFDKLSEKLGNELTNDFMTYMSSIMVCACHQSVLFYDELLTKSLQTQFANMESYINNMRADVNAHEAVLKVHGKKIDDIDKHIKLDSIKKDI